ncbi:hypothetical protein GH714_012182 [Hevea brasiliensis]|uniref:Uncharacterized protein n=1 Tax=Hevea brasiliensis TaxID=3981 RepID=A0A6A6K4L7_HEVBR|nr:hypothetical protein GH714_012182 [Hevea brasiliensis]
MASSNKPQRSLEEVEDIILRKILVVSLTHSMVTDSRIVYLDMTAAEILSEGKDLKLNRELVERVLIDRTHWGNPDMFPFNSDPKNSNVSPLLPLIFAAVDGFNISGTQPPPPRFLEDLFQEGDFDSLDPILKGLYEDLRGNDIKVSVLGNFQQPLRALLFLLSFPVGVKSFVNHPWWIPKGAYLNGRVIEMTSILWPFFHVSALPDHTIF